MSTRLLLLLALTAFLLASPSLSNPDSKAASDDDDEDLSFLDDDTDHSDPASSSLQYPDSDHFADQGDEADFSGEADDFDNFSDFDDSEDSDPYKPPEFDETDVVVLNEGNFSDFVKDHKFVLVEFYAPWCGHCQSLAPEYAAAATELKGDDVALAKVDATEESELSQEYDVQGFPTLVFFADGVNKPYSGQRTKDAIVAWIKKKTGPGISNITTLDDAQRILTSDTKVALAYLNSLVGPESQELAAASRLEDDVDFYQTVNPDVAKLFHLDPEAKRPTLVMIKKEDEKLSYFGMSVVYFLSPDGNFSRSAIAEFVFANKLPLVTIFTRENAPSVFESEIKKQLILFAGKNDSEKVLPLFQEAAKLFKGSSVYLWIWTMKMLESLFLTTLIYAPWCGHCQSLEPIYNKLAKHLKGIDSIVIAKMDGTTNEHPRAKSDGFPTLLFFPAGNKSFDPVTVDTDRTVVAFYKFIKKHASIPFKLQKPASSPTPKPASETEKSSNVAKESSSSNDEKDEL
ncbi:Protein disulfide isomerase-like 1-4 [Linum perenne]